MKVSAERLQQFGSMLSEVAAANRISVREICAEVGISATTYTQV